MTEARVAETADLRASLAELDRQVERGSQFTQAVIQRSFWRLSTAEELLTRLVNVLEERGVVDAVVDLGFEPASDDDDADDEPAPGIAWPTIALREDDAEQRQTGSSKVVDCDARMHVCQAVCCRMRFPLNAEEIDGGVVKWDLGHPYLIRQDATGRCVHSEGASGCNIYDNRPGVCRRYSCAEDPRIWTDFDGMVLNEEWINANLGPRRMQVEAVVPMETRVEIVPKPKPAAATT
jgi:Fe-S-cluster containining protein